MKTPEEIKVALKKCLGGSCNGCPYRKKIQSCQDVLALIHDLEAGPSLPGPRLQRLLGKRIQINVVDHTLQVPTPEGIVIARQGDRLILYDDDTLEVENN